MLVLKQPAEQWKANIAEALKKLRPAEYIDSNENGVCIGRYLKQNFTDAYGRTDGSVENILTAIKTCDAAKLIRWKVAPKRKPKQDVQQTRGGGCINHAQPQAEDKSRGNNPAARVDAAKEAIQQRQTEATLSQARRVFETYSAGRNHSATQQGRKVLKSHYEQLVAKGTPAEEVLHQMSIAADKQYARGTNERL
jgi:hypothetical protein